MRSPESQYRAEPPAWFQVLMFGIIPLGVLSILALMIMAGVEVISIVFDLPCRPISALHINPETDSIASRNN